MKYLSLVTFIFVYRLFQELKISDSISSLTFFVLTCTVAVENAAQNHSVSAWNVCQKKAAQISLVEVLQLEDILWYVLCMQCVKQLFRNRNVKNLFISTCPTCSLASFWASTQSYYKNVTKCCLNQLLEWKSLNQDQRQDLKRLSNSIWMYSFPKVSPIIVLVCILN